MQNGGVSFWYADMGGLPNAEPPLPGNITCDICIVGGGFTGLWTAYYLKKLDPSLDIAIIEKRFSGYGASGRNGGLLSGSMPWKRENYLKRASRESIIAMEKLAAATVDEVIGVAEAEGIDADIRRCDRLRIARNEAQAERLRQQYSHMLLWEVPSEKISLISAEDVRKRIHVNEVAGGMVTRGAANVQPAKLVRGLASVVKQLGVPIYEQTKSRSIEPGKVFTDRGVISSRVVVRATEAYTASLQGHERDVLPMNSAMVVTEPLSADQWKSIGWSGYESLIDLSHVYCYSHRTRGNRIAIGGRGVPYRFGSQTDRDGVTQTASTNQIRAMLTSLFPQLKDVKIEHTWCGVFGIPRDWCGSVGFDMDSGIAWSSGLAGTGISGSNLAARTLADLIMRRATELTRMPLVNHPIRPWEHEPFRWIGVRSMYKLYEFADVSEGRNLARKRTSSLSHFANWITGN